MKNQTTDGRDSDASVSPAKKPPFILVATVKYLLLIVLGVLFIAPFVWMLSTSLKDQAQLFVPRPKLIPNPVVWRNYATAWTVKPFTLYAFNTICITGANIILQILASSMAAYGFARLRFRLKNFWFGLLIASMMLPGSVTLIPTYLIWRSLGQVDSWLPLIVPALFGAPFYIFLLRQFYMGLPKELDEAARIDGCSYAGIWWRILLPLTKPALTTVAVFTFMGVWNDFFNPLIYITSDAKRTLALGLRDFQGQYRIDYHLMMAASMVVLLPCLIIFAFAQRYFIQGVTMSGVKG